MIKLTYLTDMDFVKMMFKRITRQNTRVYQVLMMVVITILILSAFLDIFWLMLSSVFLLGVLSTPIFIRSNSVIASRKLLSKNLINEELILQEGHLELYSNYERRVHTMKMNLDDIDKVYWHKDGFVLLIGALIYIVYKGNFESGSMDDIYQNLIAIPTIELIHM